MFNIFEKLGLSSRVELSFTSLISHNTQRERKPLIPKSGVKFGMFMQSCPKNGHLPRRFMQQLIKLHKSRFSLPRVLAFELDARFSLPSWQ